MSLIRLMVAPPMRIRRMCSLPSTTPMMGCTLVLITLPQIGLKFGPAGCCCHERMARNGMPFRSWHGISDRLEMRDRIHDRMAGRYGSEIMQRDGGRPQRVPCAAKEREEADVLGAA